MSTEYEVIKAALDRAYPNKIDVVTDPDVLPLGADKLLSLNFKGTRTANTALKDGFGSIGISFLADGSLRSMTIGR